MSVFSVHLSLYFLLIPHMSIAAKKRAKVLYSYEPENDDEIKLEVGDMVDVLKQVINVVPQF